MALSNTLELLPADQCLPGRDQPLSISGIHWLNQQSFLPPYPADTQQLVVGMGCFWGAERLFWQQPGVVATAVGYAGGVTKNPTYEEVCSGRTNHTEVVQIIFRPAEISLVTLLGVFWSEHDPTQGMRQGNDKGSQYRSAIYLTSEQDLATAKNTAKAFQTSLSAHGYGVITTDIALMPSFYYAEEYHQQYLAKRPNGYCGLRGTGVQLSGVQLAV